MKKNLDSIILTRQEIKIMKVVWKRGSASVRDVHGDLSQNQSVAYTTVLTFMGILEDKGALAHTKSGRAYIYHPVLTRQQATQNQVQDVLARFFDGNPEKLIDYLCESDIGEAEQGMTVKSYANMRQRNNVA